MNCPDKEEWITRHAAGELAPESIEELEKHLAGCSSCREELARARRLEEYLGQESMVVPPPGLVDRIVTTVIREDQESIERELISITRERKFWRIRSDLLPSLGYACAVVLISIGLGLLWPSFYESLAGMLRDAPDRIVSFTGFEAKWGIAGNLDLLITGIMMIASLCIVLGNMYPARVRLRDTLLPF